MQTRSKWNLHLHFSEKFCSFVRRSTDSFLNRSFLIYRSPLLRRNMRDAVNVPGACFLHVSIYSELSGYAICFKGQEKDSTCEILNITSHDSLRNVLRILGCKTINSS